MSSYIESAYSIEHRRLQQIVTKCQQELNEATSRLCKRRHEIENASDVFQEHMLRGQMEQKKSEEERVEHARAEAEKIRVQLNGQVSENIESEIAFSKEMRETVRHAFRTNEKSTERKKGVCLYVEKKEPEEPEEPQTSEDIKSIFEDKLNKAKSTEEIKDCALVMAKEYYEEPEFARELYARSKIKELKEMLEEKEAQDDGEHEKAVLKYMALQKLLAEKSGAKEPENETDFTAISVAALNLQCRKLEGQLLEIEKREYVAAALKKVMEKHNIPFFEEKKQGQYDENLDFSVSGLTQNKCIVEVEGKYTGSSPTLDEKRRSVTSAKKACRVFKTIYEELEREYGVVFDSISDIPPSEQTIVMKASTEAKDGRKIQKNHMSQRTFQCSGEGK